MEQGTEISSLTASEDLRSAYHHMSDPLLVEPGDNCSPSDTLMVAYERPPSLTPPAEMLLDSWPTETNIINLKNF